MELSLEYQIREPKILLDKNPLLINLMNKFKSSVFKWIN